MFATILLPLAPHSPDAATLAQVQSLVCGSDGRVVLLRLNGDQSAAVEVFKPVQRHLEAAGLICTVIERQLQVLNDSTAASPEGALNAAAVIAEVAAELNVDVIVMGGPGVNLEIDSSSTAASVIELASCPVLVVPT